MSNIALYLSIPLFMGLTVIQAAILTRFTLLGVTPQLLPIAAFAWAYGRGRAEGLMSAFIAGLFIDLFSVSPLGVSSLALMAAVVLLTLVQEAVPGERFFLPLALAALGMGLFLSLTWVLLRLFGAAPSWNGAQQLAASIVLHAFLTLPIIWLARALARLGRPRRLAH